MVLDWNSAFFFWGGRLNSLKWAVIKTLGWLGHIGYIILPSYIGDYNKPAIVRITAQIFRFRKDVSIFGPPWTSKRMSVWRPSSAEGRAEAQKMWNLFEAFNRWRIHLIHDIDFWRLSDFWEHLHVKHVTLTPFCFFFKWFAAMEIARLSLEIHPAPDVQWVPANRQSDEAEVPVQCTGGMSLGCIYRWSWGLTRSRGWTDIFWVINLTKFEICWSKNNWLTQRYSWRLKQNIC